MVHSQLQPSPPLANWPERNSPGLYVRSDPSELNWLLASGPALITPFTLAWVKRMLSMTIRRGLLAEIGLAAVTAGLLMVVWPQLVQGRTSSGKKAPRWIPSERAYSAETVMWPRPSAKEPPAPTETP